MTKTIKLLSLCTAIGAVTYGSAVYLFNNNVQKVLNSTFKKFDAKSPVQSIKERFEIKAYTFQVNFLNADKTKKMLNVQYNPLSSNAHLNYVSTIEEKIVIEEGKEFSVKFDLEQPKYLFSVKLPRNLMQYKKISDLLVDENFHISNMNTKTGKSTFTLNATQKGFDISEITDVFPISMKIVSDIRSSQFKRDGNTMTFGGDITYQMEVLMGKKPLQIIKGSSDSTLTINTNSFVNTISKAIQAGEMGQWTEEQKEDIANNVVVFLKDFKVDTKAKSEGTSAGQSDKIVSDITVNNMENNKFSMAYKITGTSTAKGRSEFLKEFLMDKEAVNKVLSATDAQFDIKSLEVKEKSAKELEDILFKTFVSDDELEHSSHLNLDFKSKADKTFLDSGKILVHTIESFQAPGEYELGVDIATAIGENFALSIDGILSYKDSAPHADLKITFNEVSYKTLMDFVQSLTNAAKKTSFQQSKKDMLGFMKSLPYDVFFQSEKNPKTDKDERVFKIQF